MKRKGIVAILTFSLALIMITFSSCEKEKETIATITVRSDSQGTIVPGAQVHLFAVGSPDIPQINEIRFDTTGFTNASGKVSFNFTEFYKAGQAGFVVLDIEASKGDLYGSGIIKIEEETTSEETVYVD